MKKWGLFLSKYGGFKSKMGKKMPGKIFEKKHVKQGLSFIDRHNHFFNKLKKSAFFTIFIK